MIEMKAGWKTSEFWITAVTSLISVLVVTGVLKSSNATDMQNAFTRAIESCAALVAAGGVIWKYISARTATKVAVADATKSMMNANPMMGASSEEGTPVIRI